MKHRILIVGQTPPPYGGQAMIIKKIIEAKYENIEVFHIRMSFSKDMSSIGRFEFVKIIHLIKIIVNIFYLKLSKNINVLYYPPSGPDRIPIYRDIFILLSIRWLFNKIIFQYFAGGLSEYYLKSGIFEKYLLKKCFFNADLSLRPSIYSPNDGEIFLCKNQMIIPWGVKDNYMNFNKNKINNKKITILFVGVLRESKGVFILLQACKILREKLFDFEVKILGDYSSEEIKWKINYFIQENKLENIVFLEGVKTGDSYYEYFALSDIFCFPSFFESENLPVVLIDAVQFGLPIVSTNWRSIPEVVIDNLNGYLLDIKDYEQTAIKLESLIVDLSLRKKMGQKSREIFLSKFSDEVFKKNMERAFYSVCNEK